MTSFCKVALAGLVIALATSCSTRKTDKIYTETQEQLHKLLKDEKQTAATRFGIIKNIAGNMTNVGDYTGAILFLTDWVENHPEDPYNAYWLLMTANTYMQNDAKPLAEYYFERIINNYSDLTIKDNDGKKHSVHFLCLQNLIKISKTPANRISYFNQLITRFPLDINITELYARLAEEYEKEGEWVLALKALAQFTAQEDAPTIQIADIPNAYTSAKQLQAFNNSSKDWTFESLEELVTAIKAALTSYNPTKLDSYKSKVNFFNMSWKQDENARTAQENFSMRAFMRGNRIRFADNLDPSSTPTEAYLRTWGWANVSVWYLYFRKVNFPSDPDIHGNWEWAGIYYGEKL